MEIVWLGALLLAFPIIAIVALVKAINLGERLRLVEQRYQALELRFADAPGTAPSQSQPAPSPPAAAAPAVEPSPAEPAASDVTAPPSEPVTPFEPKPQPPEPPAAVAEPEPTLSFEERFGTRWTVWVGGLALALGGIFLVH